MSKQLLFNTEARRALLSGVSTLTKAVKATLGPKGRNVVISKKHGSPPTITKDGVTVAREVELDGLFESIGATMVREVASRTNDVAGDGTTTATVLAEAIATEGMAYIDKGSNPIGIQRGIDKAVKAVVEHLDSIKQPVSGMDAIRQVATVSANWDKSIGDIIASAIEKVGQEGTVTVEEAKGFDTYLEVKEGMSFGRGYASPYFVKPGDNSITFENPRILVCNNKLSSAKEIIEIMKAVAADKKPLVIICDDIDAQCEAMTILATNNFSGSLRSCAVRGPGFGDQKRHMLEDIAVVTGATLLSEETGNTLEKAKLHQLGTASKVVITNGNTTIVGGAGTKEAIDSQAALVRKEIEETDSEYTKERLSERLSRLVSGVAVIKVGAHTELALKEKKDRIDDALHATKAAIEEGIVAGGGVALLSCIPAVDLVSAKDADEQLGLTIVKSALTSPIKALLYNAGVSESDGDKIIYEIIASGFSTGYNVATGKFEDLLQTGVVDPKKVTRSALENAASVAGLMLTTECAIAEVPEKEQFPMMMPQMGYHQ